MYYVGTSPNCHDGGSDANRRKVSLTTVADGLGEVAGAAVVVHLRMTCRNLPPAGGEK